MFFHSALRFLRITYRFVPSLRTVFSSFSVSVVSRVFSSLSRLLEAYVCRVRLTDWLTEQRARDCRVRTSNSSAPNLTEHGRTSPNVARPTIPRVPHETPDNPCALAPSTHNNFYVWNIFTRTILSSKTFSFLRNRYPVIALEASNCQFQCENLEKLSSTVRSLGTFVEVPRVTQFSDDTRAIWQLHEFEAKAKIFL